MSEPVGDFEATIDDGRIHLRLKGTQEIWEFDMSPQEAKGLASDLDELATLAYRE